MSSPYVWWAAATTSHASGHQGQLTGIGGGAPQTRSSVQSTKITLRSAGPII